MELSIVIPAFDERNKIAHDVTSAADFLAANSLAGQIIIVDDGSSDDTAELARTAERGSAELEVIRYEPNRGKGYAIKTGIAASTGAWTRHGFLAVQQLVPCGQDRHFTGPVQEPFGQIPKDGLHPPEERRVVFSDVENSHGQSLGHGVVTVKAPVPGCVSGHRLAVLVEKSFFI